MHAYTGQVEKNWKSYVTDGVFIVYDIGNENWTLIIMKTRFIHMHVLLLHTITFMSLCIVLCFFVFFFNRTQVHSTKCSELLVCYQVWLTGLKEKDFFVMIGYSSWRIVRGHSDSRFRKVPNSAFEGTFNFKSVPTISPSVRCVHIFHLPYLTYTLYIRYCTLGFPYISYYLVYPYYSYSM